MHKLYALPMPTGALLLNGLNKGIITGANEKHWPCLGALAIAAHEQHLGFAVADHGLLPAQRAELDRIGVWWIEHEKPDISKPTAKQLSPPEAWWKPWICLASPFERTVWIDSDAVITGDLSGLFHGTDFAVSTQFKYAPSSTSVYELLLFHLFHRDIFQQIPASFLAINTGVLAFTRHDPLLKAWANESQAILSDDAAVKRCYIRDQSSFLVMLVKRYLSGQSLPLLLPDEYNWPADGLSLRQASRRLPVSPVPQTFLHDARHRHPHAKVVHWLSNPKPAALYNAKPLLRLTGIVVCIGLSEVLKTTIEYNLQHFDEYIVVTTPDDIATQTVAASAKLVISDRCFDDHDSFNKGKLLNDGLAIATNDWILFHDADILLPPDFRQKLDGLDADKLHYAKRFDIQADGVPDWTQASSDTLTSSVGPLGYFQLWNRKSKFIAAHTPPVSEVWPTAATSDVHFMRRWPPQGRVPLNVSVAHIHHGDWASRWNGRAEPGRWKFEAQSCDREFLRSPPNLQFPCQVMLQRVDTEERLICTAHDLSRILEWHNQGLYFDIYSRKDASCE